MAIPDEDRGPVWLRDWQQIEADIAAMADFAKKLRAEVELNYEPHRSRVADDLTTTPLPPPPDAFPELAKLMQVHWAAEQDTANMVYYYTDRTGGLADAAQTISEQYRTVDAFSAARVSDVEAALTKHGMNAGIHSLEVPAATEVPDPTATDETTIPTTGAY
jgi:hypothetical protein